jgi:PAS domain S-box-containing protein
MNPRPHSTDWRAQPLPVQLYVAAVIGGGATALVWWFPPAFPRPALFAVMLVAACLTSLWKINLPIPLASSSTLSVSHAAYLMALLLLGPAQTLLIAVAGSLTQCTFRVKQRYPAYRTAFSVSAEVITMAAMSLAYGWLDGPLAPTDFSRLPQPLVGAIATYFIMNTGLVAGAIALSTGRSPWQVWRDDFLWSGASFAVASAVGAVAAVVVARGDHWLAALLLAPVYLTYRSYGLFVGRLDDQKRHLAETQRLHQEAVNALLQAREAERELAEERERLVVTLRSIGDGVITTDLDGTILTINNVAEKLTGWTTDEAVGRSLGVVFQNFDPETREPCDTPIARLAAPGGDARDLGVSRRSTILAERDLTEHPIEESTAPIRNADGGTIGMVLAFRDISDSLRIQEERAKASKLASLGLLAGGIAHDFNNILMSVMGNVSMARAAMPRPAGMSGTWLAEAEQACVRARQLTWQLLTFSKGGVPARKTIAIERILEESAALALRGSSIACRLEIAPDLATVEADAAQLVQVFSNVLINAQQAMPHGGAVTITAENVDEGDRRWENALRVEPRRYVRVSIADKGIGIPNEHLSRIFDPYFSTKQRGSGLGLATTYSIVKNHGGFLSVDSQLGRGTTVQINFPAAGSRVVEEPLDTRIRASVSRHRVLIMDDEAAIRTLAANMLEFLGYDTEVVEGGSAAIDRFERALTSGRPFDVVLLDLSVPGDLGGTEAVDRLGSLDPEVKTILMSGFAQHPAVTGFQAYGFNAVITKPFTLQELSATLHSVITPQDWRVH